MSTESPSSVPNPDLLNGGLKIAQRGGRVQARQAVPPRVAGAQVVLLIPPVVLILCVFLTARKDKVCQLAGSPSDDLCHGSSSQVRHLEIPCQAHRLSSLQPGVVGVVGGRQ